MDNATEEPILEKIGHALAGYVTHGMIGPGEFSETFAFLDTAVPREMATCPRRVYRVLVLDPSQHAALVSGQDLRFDPRSHGSWTKSSDAALSYLRIRAFKADPSSRLIVVGKEVDPVCCVADVEAIYRALSWNHPDVDEWDRYVSWEQEVILRQDDAMRTVRVEDVVASFGAGDIGAIEPHSGERIWIEDIGGFVEVAGMPDAGVDEEGAFWNVRCDDGSERTLRWDHRQDCWNGFDLVPIPAPDEPSTF